MEYFILFTFPFDLELTPNFYTHYDPQIISYQVVDSEKQGRQTYESKHFLLLP